MSTKENALLDYELTLVPEIVPVGQTTIGPLREHQKWFLPYSHSVMQGPGIGTGPWAVVVIGFEPMSFSLSGNCSNQTELYHLVPSVNRC